MTGRRIRTQQEADELNAQGPYDARTGKPIVFVVSTPELQWMEFCVMWAQIAELMHVRVVEEYRITGDAPRVVIPIEDD